MLQRGNRHSQCLSTVNDTRKFCTALLRQQLHRLQPTHLLKSQGRAKLSNSKVWRRKVPGGAAGLQNQSGGRKVPGGFDSLPSPPHRPWRCGSSRERLGVALSASAPATLGSSRQRRGTRARVRRQRKTRGRGLCRLRARPRGSVPWVDSPWPAPRSPSPDLRP